jgi:RHS repeat-associated protein
MSGDVVDIFGKSFYHLNSGQIPTNTYNIASSALMALITNFAGSNPVQALHSGITSNDLTNNPNNGVTEWLTGVPTPDQSVHHTPKAYINWVLLDDRFEVVTAGSGFDLVSLNPDVLKSHHKTVNIPVNGYLYVYCSNESNIDLFFDNLQVIQTHGPLVEETHYYPFGLTMAGISSQALNFGNPDNRKLYNGNELQNKEFSDGSGLETIDFNARMYDQQLGRFWQIDPLSQYMRRWSPYSFGFDNPIRFNDPTGRNPGDTIEGRGQDVVVTTSLHKDNGFWSGVGNFLWGAVDYIPFAGSIKQIGVGIYHGDWKEAGLGVVMLGVDVFTAGEGGEALRVGETVAEDALKIAAEDEVKEIGESEVKEGVYEFKYQDEKTGEVKDYTGQSKDIDRRLDEHAANGKKPIEGTVKRTEVAGGKTAREIKETQILRGKGGPGGMNGNQRWPVSAAREAKLRKAGIWKD